MEDRGQFGFQTLFYEADWTSHFPDKIELNLLALGAGFSYPLDKEAPDMQIL